MPHLTPESMIWVAPIPHVVISNNELGEPHIRLTEQTAGEHAGALAFDIAYISRQEDQPPESRIAAQLTHVPEEEIGGVRVFSRRFVTIESGQSQVKLGEPVKAAAEAFWHENRIVAGFYDDELARSLDVAGMVEVEKGGAQREVYIDLNRFVINSLAIVQATTQTAVAHTYYHWGVGG